MYLSKTCNEAIMGLETLKSHSDRVKLNDGISQ